MKKAVFTLIFTAGVLLLWVNINSWRVTHDPALFNPALAPLPNSVSPVRAVSDGIEHMPYIAHFLHGYIRQGDGSVISASGRPMPPLHEILEANDEILFSDAFKIIVEGENATAPRFTLYNDRLERIYQNSETLYLPQEAGIYILMVTVGWSHPDGGSSVAYFFKLRK